MLNNSKFTTCGTLKLNYVLCIQENKTSLLKRPTTFSPKGIFTVLWFGNWLYCRVSDKKVLFIKETKVNFRLFWVAFCKCGPFLTNIGLNL